MLAEFKTFIARGNVMELAIGVLIGAALGKIVSALTDGMLMPLIGWLFGDIDFSNWFVRLGPIPADYRGSPTSYAQLKEAGVPMIGYGDFLTQTLDFLIIATALFFLVRSVNRLTEEVAHRHRREKAAADEAAARADPQLEVLQQILAELRKRG
jgi:large conductance mechanosensitive channel